MKKLLVLGMLCLLLAGCAGGGIFAAEPTAAPTEAPTAAPAVTPEPAATEAPTPEPTATPEPAYEGPVFTAETLTGESIDESYIRGNRLTMVNFWATWCGPCVGEMPDLAVIHTDYADQGFGILGVMIWDGDVETAREFIAQQNIGYPIILAEDTFNAMSADYIGIPTTVFFDAYGVQVGETQLGSMSDADWRALIDSLLTELD